MSLVSNRRRIVGKVQPNFFGAGLLTTQKNECQRNQGHMLVCVHAKNMQTRCCQLFTNGVLGFYQNSSTQDTAVVVMRRPGRAAPIPIQSHLKALLDVILHLQWKYLN